LPPLALCKIVLAGILLTCFYAIYKGLEGTRFDTYEIMSL